MERDEKRTREREAFASLDTQYTYSYGHTLDICGCGDMCAVQLVAPISFSPCNIFESNWKWIIFSRSFSLLSFYCVWLSFCEWHDNDAPPSSTTTQYVVPDRGVWRWKFGQIESCVVLCAAAAMTATSDHHQRRNSNEIHIAGPSAQFMN